MTAVGFFWLGALAFLLLVLASIGAKVIYEVAWHDLKEFCIKNDQRALFDAIHDDHDDVTLGLETLRSLSIMLLAIASAGWCAFSGDEVFSNWSTVGWIGALLAALVATTVWLPNAVSEWGEVVIYHCWRLFRFASYAVLPFSIGAIGLENAFRRMVDEPDDQTEEEAFEEEVLTIVTEAMHDGHLQDDAREMIEGVIELGDADVADIMTERSKMDMIPIDMEWPDILQQVVSCGRTRIPVHGESQDKIIGILFVKDLLAELAEAKSTESGMPAKRLGDLLRKPWYVSPTRKLDDLLQDFRSKREHLAIVKDEFKRIAGIVTIEDVLEEIVGEIVDETDKEQIEEIMRLDEHTAIIQGRTHLADINESLGLELPEPGDFDTIAGFVMNHLGRIPRTGESFEVAEDEIRITVIAANKRKVERVKLESTGDKLRMPA